MFDGSSQDNCLQVVQLFALMSESMRYSELLELCRLRYHQPSPKELAWFLCASGAQCGEGTKLDASASNRRFRFAKYSFQLKTNLRAEQVSLPTLSCNQCHTK